MLASLLRNWKAGVSLTVRTIHQSTQFRMSRYRGVAVNEAQQHIINVRKYMKMQQYVLAELEIRRAEALQLSKEEQHDLLMLRGEMEIDKLQPDLVKAIEYFDAAVKGDKYNIRASLHKVECLLELNQLEVRLVEIATKEKTCKLSQSELVEKAYGLYLTNRYGEARSAYDECLVTGLTTAPQIYEHQAICSLALKDHARAESAFLKHHQLVPGNTQTVAYLVSILWLQGKYQQIVQLCEEVIKIDPSEVFAERFKGQCLYMVGDYQGAIRSLNRTIELDETPESYYYRAMAKRKASDQTYLDDFRRMMELQPTDISMIVEACTLLGESCIANGDALSAQNYFKQGLQYQPDNATLKQKLQQAVAKP